MTDEEYGRAWARKMGRKPFHQVDGPYCEEGWGWKAIGGTPSVLPGPIMWVFTEIVGTRVFITEAVAYESLGRAVRAVHQQVPVLSEV